LRVGVDVVANGKGIKTTESRKWAKKLRREKQGIAGEKIGYRLRLRESGMAKARIYLGQLSIITHHSSDTRHQTTTQSPTPGNLSKADQHTHSRLTSTS
jgi:hypothetical protein